MKQNEDQVRELCRQYRGAKRGIIIAEKGLEAILNKIESSETERERKQWEIALGHKQDEVNAMGDIIIAFETCIMALPEDERSVIEQLYVKEKKWAEVTDIQGDLLPIKDSIKLWKRAKRRMARYL